LIPYNEHSTTPVIREAHIQLGQSVSANTNGS
jgi:hypothetical protein